MCVHRHIKEVEKGERKRKKEAKNLTLLSFGDDEEIEEMESSGRTPFVLNIVFWRVVIGWTKTKGQRDSKEKTQDGDEGMAVQELCVAEQMPFSCKACGRLGRKGGRSAEEGETGRVCSQSAEEAKDDG